MKLSSFPKQSTWPRTQTALGLSTCARGLSSCLVLCPVGPPKAGTVGSQWFLSLSRPSKRHDIELVLSECWLNEVDGWLDGWMNGWLDG